MMPADKAIRDALDSAWHRDAAASSLQRWLEVCAQQQWEQTPVNLPLLVKLFGTSWYFTRFIFYRGDSVIHLVDDMPCRDFNVRTLIDYMENCIAGDDAEQSLDQLVILKNEYMLQILIAYLTGKFNQQEVENALTSLAEACLDVVMGIFELRREQVPVRVGVLGMGRMAGNEMTFGSDLDLIFLYETAAAEELMEITRKIRLLLRSIASIRPSGTLYDVDMRLRPHGTAGALISSVDSFIDYHHAARDIWERQVMTRCRVVFDTDGIALAAMEKITPDIYADYEPDFLQHEISIMRMRVEKELGRPSGKFEMKRGKGGIMDIDFVTHYLQLRYGHKIPALITGSTRTALRLLAENNLLGADTRDNLLQAYDYLKQVEMSLRLFDLKSISAFPREPAANIALARAMGYADAEADDFIEDYISLTNRVRELYKNILGPVDC